MRFSAMMSASVLALAVLGAMVDGSLAKPQNQLKQSCMSNGGIWTSDGHHGGSCSSNQTVDAKDCTDHGGTVTTGPAGNKFCALKNTVIRGAESNEPGPTKPFSDKDCTNQGGTVTTNAAGSKFCALKNTAIRGAQSNEPAPTKPFSDKDCTDRGGTVTTDAAGNKFCALKNTVIH